MFLKGQISTEYRLILVVVLVVALVVVYLAGGFAGLGNIETQSQHVWATTAPLSITSVMQSGSTLQMEIQNNDVETITLTGIFMDGGSVFSNITTFGSGEKKILTVATTVQCDATGSLFTHENVILVYNKGKITGKTEIGARPLMGRCS